MLRRECDERVAPVPEKHAEHHRRDEYDGLPQPEGEARYRWSGTESREAPAHAEQRRPAEEPRIDPIPRGEMEFGDEQRMRPSKHDLRVEAQRVRTACEASISKRSEMISS